MPLDEVPCFDFDPAGLRHNNMLIYCLPFDTHQVRVSVVLNFAPFKYGILELVSSRRFLLVDQPLQTKDLLAIPSLGNIS